MSAVIHVEKKKEKRKSKAEVGGGHSAAVWCPPLSLRSKELTERWVCPFSCCEWRDHLSYPSTLPVARPGSRGGRWLLLTACHFFNAITTDKKGKRKKTQLFPLFLLLRLLLFTFHPRWLFVLAAESVAMIFSFSSHRTPRCCAVCYTKAWIFFPSSHRVEVDLPGYAEEQRRGVYWNQKAEEFDGNPPAHTQIKHAAEETRSAQARSRYVRVSKTVACVKRSSFTADVTFCFVKLTLQSLHFRFHFACVCVCVCVCVSLSLALLLWDLIETVPP